MNSSVLKSVFRGLKKQKLTAFINITGLAIGLTAVMYIAVYLKNELQTDQFHQNSKNIYRIEAEVQTKVYPLTASPMSQWMKDNFPEVELSARIFSPFFSTVYFVKVDNRFFEVKQPVFVDPSFFKIFSFPVKYGNVSQDFDTKYSVVITEQMAKKLFGNENAVGKTLNYCGNHLLTVTAVLEKLPVNSSMQFELLLPFASFNDYNSFDLNSWDRLTYQTIVKSNSEPGVLSSEINQKIKEQFPEKKFKYSLMPFNNIHFSASSAYDLIFRHGNKVQLYLFMLVAVCILLIAVINFVNLTVSLSSPRFRENSIRRIEGASQWQLSGKFIVESVLISLMSAMLAIMIIMGTFRLFNNLLDHPLDFYQIQQPWFYLCLFGLSIITGLVAGAYPAYKFSRVSVANVMHNKYATKYGSGGWKNGLLVFQFAISIALIISNLFLSRQMNYIQDHQLGFDKEQVLFLKLDDDLIKQKDFITGSLEEISGVEYVSTCNFVPGQAFSQKILSLKVNGEKQTHQVYRAAVSDQYIKTLGITIIGGRDFDPSRQADQKNYLVNEAFVKEYNIQEPLETPIEGGKIIGVVKDFNFCSLHDPIGPMMMSWGTEDPTTMLIRCRTSKLSDMRGIISSVQQSIEGSAPNSYVEVQFLDESVKRLYIKDSRTTQLLGYFSFFAIFISCMGLFALVRLTINTRTKEIGIRKVNGARIFEVLVMLNKEFVKWVVIAFAVAAPIAYYAMNKWLENFAYKSSLSWWIFVLAGFLTLGISLLTVSWQCWKAAIRNPVEVLRYE